MMYLEDVFDEELGAEASKKKKVKLGAKLKRGFKAVATGGMSEAARAAKKTKIGRKIIKGATAVMTGGASLAISAAKKKLGIKGLKKAGVSKSSIKKAAKAVIAKVKAKPSSECTCDNELARTVAAKLVAELGPPLNAANKALAKLELQRKATYEHKRLMNDAEFKRKVLTFIAQKAKSGNKSAARTIDCLRG